MQWAVNALYQGRFFFRLPCPLRNRQSKEGASLEAGVLRKEEKGMSVRVMGAVWDLDIPRAQKFVLLAYADHADHEGHNIWPAVPTIAKKTGYKDRAVQSITRSLERDGYLVDDGEGINGTNKFRIPMRGAEIAPLPSKGVQKTTGGGAKKTPKPWIYQLLQPKRI